MEICNSINIMDLNDTELNDVLAGPMHRLDLIERIARDHLSSNSKSYRRPRKLPRNITRGRRRRTQSQ